MAASPQVPAALPDGTIGGDRTRDFGHVAALTNEPPFLHEKFAFIFRIGAAWSDVIKLRGTGEHVVTAVTDLSGSK